MNKNIELININVIKQKITEKWTELENIPNIFRYQLNVKNAKILPGKFQFFIELNEDRIMLRRPPQQITSIIPAFDEKQFNFNKIDKREILFNINIQQVIVTFLINNSPLTKYHLLLCPNLQENLPQILTEDALRVSIDILRKLNDPFYRIGYNSPGALASVNHLHLHLIHIEQRCFMENVILKPIIKNLFEIHDEMYPTKGFCFPIENGTIDLNPIIMDCYKLIQFLCNENIPHNLFITYGNKNVFNSIKMENCSSSSVIKKDESSKIMAMTIPEEHNINMENTNLKIFIYPRKNSHQIKTFNTFNIAFCELSGYVPVGSQEVYDNITEDEIVNRIFNETGNIMNDIRAKVKDLYS